MATWNDIIQEVEALPPADRSGWLTSKFTEELARVGVLRGGRHVVFYGSAFLQKPLAATQSMITFEDVHGLMSAFYQADCAKGLTLILHTPGGVTNAAESLVSYIRSKFDDVEVIVPALAMSAGTMIALAADRIVLGRQSQLGPIDPQMGLPDGRSISAQAVVEQFNMAKREVLDDPRTAHVWASVLPSLGPGLLQEAQNALDYSEDMVAKWLAQWSLSASADPAAAGRSVAHHFNDAQTHKSHGRRIGAEEAKAQGLNIEDLEAHQELQMSVLTAYHLATVLFEQSPIAKMVWTGTGRSWLKQVAVAGPAA